MNETKIPKGYKQTEIGVIPEEWEFRRLVKSFTFSWEICLTLKGT